MLQRGQPWLRQDTDLGIVLQNALHDARFLFALLWRQRVLRRLRAQLTDQHGTGLLAFGDGLPIAVHSRLQHVGTGVFNGFITIEQLHLLGSLVLYAAGVALPCGPISFHPCATGCSTPITSATKAASLWRLAWVSCLPE